jgi:hypothetical protein
LKLGVFLLLLATTTSAVGCAMRHPDQELEDRYRKWSQAVDDMPRYSKSAAFTQLPEYRSLVALGPPAVPLLAKKLAQNGPNDLFLSDAIIEILKLDPGQFNQTDLQEKRAQVLDELARRGVDLPSRR